MRPERPRRGAGARLKRARRLPTGGAGILPPAPWGWREWRRTGWRRDRGRAMNRSSYEWLAPLTGVAFFVVLIVGFIIAGEPTSARRSGRGDRRVLGRQQGLGDGRRDPRRRRRDLADLLRRLPAQGVARGSGRGGDAVVGRRSSVRCSSRSAVAIDATISFALAEAADDIDPTAVQALQALWDNDFVPLRWACSRSSGPPASR